MLIAIDGPAASGKGTLAKRLARHFGRPHLDTGLLYRAVAHGLLRDGKPLTSEAEAARTAQTLDVAHLDEGALRGRIMGDAASIVSAYPSVRAALLAYQRRFAAQEGGAVLDGRDIGTVVVPDAPIKLFVTATADERARRRHKELCARGEATPLDEVLADIQRRDERDSGRSAAPLKAALDAILLDTTDLGPDAAFAAALAIVEERSRHRASILQAHGKLPD